MCINYLIKESLIKNLPWPIQISPPFFHLKIVYFAIKSNIFCTHIFASNILLQRNKQQVENHVSTYYYWDLIHLRLNSAKLICISLNWKQGKCIRNWTNFISYRRYSNLQKDYLLFSCRLDWWGLVKGKNQLNNVHLYDENQISLLNAVWRTTIIRKKLADIKNMYQNPQFHLGCWINFI